jgi:hypothetical protein
VRERWPQGSDHRLRERAAALEAVACMVAVLLILGVLVLLLVVVLRSRLRRFVMIFEAWKIKFRVEVDSEARPEEKPEGRHRALPGGESETR